MRDARALQRRDPDAAALLFAQIEAERARRAALLVDDDDASDFALPVDTYDPLDLYTRLAREFGWRDADFDEMDYVRFFGYVDRLSKQQRRERDEIEAGRAAPRGAPVVDAEGALAQMGGAPVRSYEGRTVAYG